MSTCKDCIHEIVCSALIEKGLPWEDGEYPAEAFCMSFRNKADVVEVVRCKDCKHYKAQAKSSKWHSDTKYCYRCTKVKVNDEDYCSYGEKCAKTDIKITENCEVFGKSE